MALEAIGGEITSPPLNRNFSELDSKKVSKLDLPYLNIADYGALGGSSNDTNSLQTAINEAISQGVNGLYIPYKKLTVTAIDCKGLVLKGSNTSINGNIKNVKRFEDCIINNIDYEELEMTDLPSSIPVSPKVVEKRNADSYYVLSKRPFNDKYLLFLLERGIVTDTNSIGGDAELMRPTFVYNIDKAYVYAHEYIGYGGTWEEYSYAIDDNASTRRDIIFWRNTSQALNDYLRFDISVPESGEFTLMFYSTGASDPAARITVDNVDIDTVDLTSFQGNIMIKKFQTTPGTKAIRIYTSGAYYIYCAGYNAYPVKDAVLGQFYDSMAFSGGGNPYISNKGAIDYAFYDVDEGAYYGSYHGGETLNSEQLQLDGANTGLTTGQITVKKSFVLKQETNIHNKFTSNTVYQIKGDGLLEFTADLEGNANLSTAYNCMTTTDNNFTNVIFPRKVDITTDGEYYFGRTNKIIQENPNTAQKITTFLTLYKNDNNALGGLFIRRTTGAYNKVYYGKVVQSLENIKNLSFETKWLFE